MPGTVLSVFAVNPQRIGGVEMFVRELSLQLDAFGWKSVLCFTDAPPQNVERFLAVPGVSLERLPGIERLRWSVVRDMSRILRKHAVLSNKRRVSKTKRIVATQLASINPKMNTGDCLSENCHDQRVNCINTWKLHIVSY